MGTKACRDPLAVERLDRGDCSQRCQTVNRTCILTIPVVATHEVNLFKVTEYRIFWNAVGVDALDHPSKLDHPMDELIRL